ncbi:MAG: hypothetical protein WCG47_09565, partial [Dermatophilaceae bacterium]
PAAHQLLAAGWFVLSWFWAVIAAIFVIERLVIAWPADGGSVDLPFPWSSKRAMTWVLQAAHVKSLFNIATAGPPDGTTCHDRQL